MPQRSIIILSILFALQLVNKTTTAQTRGVHDTILMSGVVYGNDTIPAQLLSTVYIYSAPTLYSKKEWKRRRGKMTKYQRLRYNVYKTYPYAVMASYVVHDIDSAFEIIQSKSAKKQYKTKKEEELMKKYKKELENLTMSQGKVLVKLIARQTNKDCYTIIKDLKGGFNARVWQALAVLFKNDLKGGYDATGRDKDIETIVLEIEKRGRFKRIKN